MRWLFAGLLTLASLPAHAVTQVEVGIRITAPISGDVVQGLANIVGTSAMQGFLASELSFAYASDTTDTWFLIYSTDQPITDGLLAAWDTRLVTDGDYNLRLRVTLQDGTAAETLLFGLRVRNMTPTETFTPAPTETPLPTITATGLPDNLPTPMLATPVPAVIPTSTTLATPTSLPPNPAAVTPDEINSFLVRGILLTLLSFVTVGIFLRYRRSW